MTSMARINEYCVGLAKVISLTVTREPIKSQKHLIPFKRCNWLIGSPRHDARKAFIVKCVYGPMKTQRADGSIRDFTLTQTLESRQEQHLLLVSVQLMTSAIQIA